MDRKQDECGYDKEPKPADLRYHVALNVRIFRTRLGKPYTMTLLAMTPVAASVPAAVRPILIV